MTGEEGEKEGSGRVSSADILMRIPSSLTLGGVPYFSCTSSIHVGEGEVTFAVPHALYKDRLESDHMEALRKAVTSAGLPADTRITIVSNQRYHSIEDVARPGATKRGRVPYSPRIPSRMTPSDVGVSRSGVSPVLTVPAVHKPVESQAPSDYRGVPFDLENFVPGDNNAYAYATAQALGRNDGLYLAPTVFYGGSGLGKSALLASIVKAVKSSAHYTAESLAKAIGTNRADLDGFFDGLIGKRVLVVDDLHRIADQSRAPETKRRLCSLLKIASGEETHPTIRNRPTLLFAVEGDRETFADLPFEDHLKGRVLGCNWIGIEPYSQETAARVAERQLALIRRHNPLYPDVSFGCSEAELGKAIVEYSGETNPRQLFGLTEKVIGHAWFSKQPVTPETVRKALTKGVTSTDSLDAGRNPTNPAFDNALDLDGIVNSVAESLFLKPDHIYRPSPAGTKAISDVVSARAIAAYLATQLDIARGTHRYGMQGLGKTLGHVSHSTISKSVTNLKRNPELRLKTRNLAAKLGIPIDLEATLPQTT